MALSFRLAVDAGLLRRECSRVDADTMRRRKRACPAGLLVDSPINLPRAQSTGDKRQRVRPSSRSAGCNRMTLTREIRRLVLCVHQVLSSAVSLLRSGLVQPDHQTLLWCRLVD
jgi:hypothetical protein